MSKKMLEVTVSVLYWKLYVVGGHDGGTALNTCAVFDFVTGVWSAIAPMPSARYSHVVVEHGGKVYVVGGHDGSTYVNTCGVYDCATGVWSASTPMPSARRFLGVASF